MVIGIVLTVGLMAGCIGDGPTVAVPLARVGDVVEYDVTQVIDHPRMSPSTQTQRFEILGAEEIQHVDGSRLQAVRVGHHTERPNRDPPHDSRSTILFIDAAHNLMVREVDGTNVTNFLSPQPWAFGSSLMQGQTLIPGRAAPVQILVEGHAVTVTGHTVRTWTEGGIRHAELQWTTGLDVDIVPKAQHAWLTGTVVATDASPYVKSGTLEYRFYTDLLGTWLNLTQSVTQSAYRSGTGAPLAPTSTINDVPECLPAVGPVQNGLPSGAHEAVGPMRTTFGELLDVLVEDNAPAREHLAQSGAYVSNMRIYQTSEPPQPVLMGYSLAGAHVRVHADPGMVNFFEVERKTQWLTVVPESTYAVTYDGQIQTGLPPYALTDDLVSVASVLERHFERYPTGDGGMFGAMLLVTSDGFALAPTLSADGQHYDLRTGCLRQTHGMSG